MTSRKSVTVRLLFYGYCEPVVFKYFDDFFPNSVDFGTIGFVYK